MYQYQTYDPAFMQLASGLCGLVVLGIIITVLSPIIAIGLAVIGGLVAWLLLRWVVWPLLRYVVWPVARYVLWPLLKYSFIGLLYLLAWIYDTMAWLGANIRVACGNGWLWCRKAFIRWRMRRLEKSIQKQEAALYQLYGPEYYNRYRQQQEYE